MIAFSYVRKNHQSKGKRKSFLISHTRLLLGSWHNQMQTMSFFSFVWLMNKEKSPRNRLLKTSSTEEETVVCISQSFDIDSIILIIQIPVGRLGLLKHLIRNQAFVLEYQMHWCLVCVCDCWQCQAPASWLIMHLLHAMVGQMKLD